MQTVIREFLECCKEVVPESHYLSNGNPNVMYPYLVFSYSGDNNERGKDGAYIDLDIFDNQGTNQERIETTVSQLKEHLKHHRAMLDDCFLRVQYQSSGAIDTGSDKLQRRTMRFYLTIDWRKNNG